MIKTVAVYIRLSLEDSDMNASEKMESESITNQRHLLHEFIANSPDLCDAQILEFCDDGWSGKNFERPSVKRLVEAARNGAIQCIIVKDLSRLGRDYLTVGNYVSRVFPFLGIRFIAINDNFDSNRVGDINRLDTTFKMLMNDMYSRDLSKKVLSAKRTLLSNGVYINPVPPYGYKKDPHDKHLLRADPVASAIIVRIFTLVAGGKSSSEVARILNAEQIATPSRYKEGTPSYHANWDRENFWTVATIVNIVRDRQYMGSLVWGKRVRPRIGVRQQLTAKIDDWHIADDHHEPIVSKELYAQAQNGLGGVYTQNKAHVFKGHPLNKKVFCGVCGRAIVRKGKTAQYYRCDTPKVMPEAQCFQDKVYVHEIIEVVTEAIRGQAQYAVEHLNILDAEKQQLLTKIHTLQSEIQRLCERQTDFAKQNIELYENFVDKMLPVKTYLLRKEEAQEQQNRISMEIAEKEKALSVLQSGKDGMVEHFSKHTALDELTHEIAADLIKRITVWPEGKLEISFHHMDGISCFIMVD